MPLNFSFSAKDIFEVVMPVIIASIIIVVGYVLRKILFKSISRWTANTKTQIDNIIFNSAKTPTLVAAEVAPTMAIYTIKSVLLGLLIAGGMLIPGNIPNIICANKLSIRMKDWACFGIPLGLILMIMFFAIFAITG